MAGTPSTPDVDPATYPFGVTGQTPKLVLPPMTVSPGVTRLDRVLDLVTEHEAQFRDVELRVVDLSTRVANVEQAVGVAWSGGETTHGGGFSGAVSGAATDGSMHTPHHPATSNPQMTLRGLQDAIQSLRNEVDEALDEIRADMKAFVEESQATKKGFKIVLRDVLDRVAGQIDNVRNADQGNSHVKYASAAELSALVERLSVTELTIADFTKRELRSTGASSANDSEATNRALTAERKVDALTAELARMKSDGDDLRRRVAELAVDVRERDRANSHGMKNDGHGKASHSGGVGVGFVPSMSDVSIASTSSNSAWNKYMPPNENVSKTLENLARCFDAQAEETAALKDTFWKMRIELDDRAMGRRRLKGGRSSLKGKHAHSHSGSPLKTHVGTAGNTEWSSPRVKVNLTTAEDADGLVRLGFGAYTGAGLTGSGLSSASMIVQSQNKLRIPDNAGFVAEASKRTQSELTTIRIKADKAAESFREYVAGLGP